MQSFSTLIQAVLFLQVTLIATQSYSNELTAKVDMACKKIMSCYLQDETNVDHAQIKQLQNLPLISCIHGEASAKKLENQKKEYELAMECFSKVSEMSCESLQRGEIEECREFSATYQGGNAYEAQSIEQRYYKLKNTKLIRIPDEPVSVEVFIGLESDKWSKKYKLANKEPVLRDELYIPVDQKVRFIFSSSDIVRTCSNLSDIEFIWIPGFPKKEVFTFDQIGELQLSCYTSIVDGKKRGVKLLNINVTSSEKFDEWVSKATSDIKAGNEN